MADITRGAQTVRLTLKAATTCLLPNQLLHFKTILSAGMPCASGPGVGLAWRRSSSPCATLQALKPWPTCWPTPDTLAALRSYQVTVRPPPA